MTTETEDQEAMNIAVGCVAEDWDPCASYGYYRNMNVLEFARRLLAWEREKQERFVLTRNQDNEAVALTRQDDEGKIVEVLWEREKAEPLCVIFDGPPGPDGGCFVEVETANGKGVRVGKWTQCLHDARYWQLGPFYAAPPAAQR